MYIAIVCFPSCGVINVEINLIFLIKPSLYMTKKSRQKFKHLENENSFEGEIKSVFIKGLSVAQNCLRPESAPLTLTRLSAINSSYLIRFMKHNRLTAAQDRCYFCSNL